MSNEENYIFTEFEDGVTVKTSKIWDRNPLEPIYPVSKLENSVNNIEDTKKAVNDFNTILMKRRFDESGKAFSIDEDTLLAIFSLAKSQIVQFTEIIEKMPLKDFMADETGIDESRIRSVLDQIVNTNKLKASIFSIEEYLGLRSKI